MAKNVIIAGLASISLMACASTAVGPEAASRFDSFSLVSSDTTLSGYDKIYIAPVEVSDDVAARVGYRTKGTSDRIRPLGERDIREQSEELASDVANALARNFELVDAAGPGVMTIAMTITDLDANRPTIAELRDKPGLSLSSVSTGGASVSIEFRVDGTRVAVASDSNLGMRSIDEISGGVWSEANRMYQRLGNKLAALLG